MNRPVDTIEEGFCAFVAQRAHALLKAAYALTGDQHAAQDLVQAALAKAFVRWRRITGEAEPYVRRIIYHDFVSIWRGRKRHEIVVARPPEPRRAGIADDDADVRIALRQALLALPPRQRAVIVLRYLEDRSIEETAAILACRERTVASQTSRALAKLRQMVPGLQDDHLSGVRK